MGITGLLPFLKNSLQPASMKEYRGCTVAIDSYCWLHKGAFSCAEKLANNEKTDQYVYYCLKFVNMLLSYDIKPIMVFDGCRLPSKRDVEKQRRERREMYRKKAAQLLREGKKAEARECLTKCVDITPQMALELIKACRSKGVDCIVAPYEADAQLAYLSRTGAAQIIITEDSDLILFGCEKVMFKMDGAGNGMMLNRADLHRGMDMRAECYSFDKFRYMCILSGCDYLASLPGIGLKKAQKLFQRTRQPDIRQVLKKLPSVLNMNVTVTSEYIEGFVRADNTFLYQLVYDATQRKLLPLNPYPTELDIRDLSYAGPPISQDKALQIALGNIDIYTGKLMDDFDPDDPVYRQQQLRYKSRDQKEFLHKLSIWDRDYRPLSQHNKQPRQDGVERKTTVGKVCTAQLPSVLKRPRPQEPEVSESELASLYSGGPKKKHCPNATADFLSSIDTSITQSATVTVEPAPKKTHANPFAKSKAPESELLQSPPEEKRANPNPFAKSKSEPESPLKEVQAESVTTPSPPSKNPFRRKMNSANKRFVLNEQKTEVVSRFFSKSKTLQPTPFGKELEKNLEKPKEKPKPSWEQSESESEDKSNESEPEVNEKESAQVTKEPPKMNSPYGLFNKLKLFQSKYDPSLKSSPATSSNFKPVLSRSNSTAEKYCSSENSTQDLVLDTRSQKSTALDTSFERSTELDSSTALDTALDISADTGSQRSIALCSIDTDSLSQPALPQLPDSDDSAIMSTPKQRNTLSSFFYRKSSSGFEPPSKSSQSTPKSTSPTSSASEITSNSNSKKVSTGRGSCRQSGLRRQSPKEGSSKENNTIHNFLSKFKHSSTPKQSMPRQQALSPSNR